MTQQEQQLLDGLIQRVNSTQLQSKDSDAERMLVNALGPNPDALYILCQTVLVQQFAMENSQNEIATLRTQMQQMQQAPPANNDTHGSFLGNLFGLKKDAAPAAPAGAPGYAPVHDPGSQYGAGQPQGYPQYGSAQPQGYPPYGGQPGYPPPPGYGYGGGYAPPMGGGGGMFGGGGGFLAGAAQTAAGVVAGEVAFRAIEGMFSGGHDGHGFSGQPEVVNNYYEDNNSRSGDGSSFGDRLQSADGLDGGISSDIEDRRGESHGFFGDGDGGDSSNFADDDSGVNDDSGSFDDGGGFDNSGGGDDSGF